MFPDLSATGDFALGQVDRQVEKPFDHPFPGAGTVQLFQSKVHSILQVHSSGS